MCPNQFLVGSDWPADALAPLFQTSLAVLAGLTTIGWRWRYLRTLIGGMGSLTNSRKQRPRYSVFMRKRTETILECQDQITDSYVSMHLFI